MQRKWMNAREAVSAADSKGIPQLMLIDEQSGRVLTPADSSAASFGARAEAAAAPGPADALAGAAKSNEAKAGPEEKTPAISPVEKGELIKRDVEPAIVFNTKGEKLSQIARDHLGPDASDEEVRKHVAEIARINGIKDPDRPLAGGRLSLPGHSQDGGFVTADADGHKRTIWQNGLVRVDNLDNSGYERRPAGDGNYFEHHWGSDPKDHSYLIKRADGSYVVADGQDDRQGHKAKNEQERLLVERVHLIDAADEKIADPKERAQFRKDMQEFEERMNKRVEAANQVTDQLVKERKLTEDAAAKRREADALKAKQELTDTFRETSRLLEAKDNPNLPVKESDRVIIAEQILHQSAQPTNIDQGHHDTCAVTSLEARTYSREPSKAAKVVVDAATEGHFEVAGPPRQMVPVDPTSLKADFEAREHPVPDGRRSYASQIFQVAAVNSFFATNACDYRDAAGRTHQAEPGQLRFEQRDPIPGEKPRGTGERLMDYSRTPPQEVHQRSAGKEASVLSPYQIMEVDRQLLGGDGKDLVLMRAFDPKNSNQVRDEQALGKELERLKAEGKLPVIVAVHTDNYPFHPAGADEAGGVGGGHQATVTDYDPQTGKVKIDNEWGSAWDNLDKGVSVHDLFEALQVPSDKSHISRLEEEVAGNRDQNTVDYLKETELLRLKRGAKMLDDKQLSAQLEERYEAFLRQEEGMNGERDREREKRVHAEFRELIASLSPVERQKLNMKLKAYAREHKVDLT